MTLKACKICGNKFTPYSTLQKACSIGCALELGKGRKKKTYAQETRKRKQAFLDKDKVHWKKKAVHACHAYIRARDGDHCISCGESRPGNQIQAGHYRTRGAASQLQFHWANINGQCSRCNSNLSGNLLEYRRHLTAKYGEPMVTYLENENSVYTWTLEDYKGVAEHFKERLKSLVSARDAD